MLVRISGGGLSISHFPHIFSFYAIGISPTAMKLVYEGRELKDTDSLNQYDFVRSPVIHLITCPPSPPPLSTPRPSTTHPPKPATVHAHVPSTTSPTFNQSTQTTMQSPAVTGQATAPIDHRIATSTQTQSLYEDKVDEAPSTDPCSPSTTPLSPPSITHSLPTPLDNPSPIRHSQSQKWTSLHPASAEEEDDVHQLSVLLSRLLDRLDDQASDDGSLPAQSEFITSTSMDPANHSPSRPQHTKQSPCTPPLQDDSIDALLNSPSGHTFAPRHPQIPTPLRESSSHSQSSRTAVESTPSLPTQQGQQGPPNTRIAATPAPTSAYTPLRTNFNTSSHRHPDVRDHAVVGEVDALITAMQVANSNASHFKQIFSAYKGSVGNYEALRKEELDRSTHSLNQSLTSLTARIHALTSLTNSTTAQAPTPPPYPSKTHISSVPSLPSTPSFTKYSRNAYQSTARASTPRPPTHRTSHRSPTKRATPIINHTASSSGIVDEINQVVRRGNESAQKLREVLKGLHQDDAAKMEVTDQDDAVWKE